MSKINKQRGSILVSILMIMLFLFIIISALDVLANSNLSRAKRRILLLESQYAAESGADAAIATLNSDPNSTYTGTGATQTTILSNNLYKATYQTSVNTTAGSQRVITSTGRVFKPANASTPTLTRKIEVVAQRTSDSVIASGMISRNIIEVASSVKDIYAKDLYVNNYIQMDKTSSAMHSETITAAGRNTGASNCSLGGGTLIKPSSFFTPGQTKTKITVAYNNCITPPGNTSNSDFDVFANQNTLNKIQSTYLPWSQYMDSSYTSAGSCNDWTGNAATINIPSTSGSKKTHYPDSSSNISTSCGTSGDITLNNTSTYTINDNVHLRANLCATNGCSPIFNNPSSSPRYIFIEGTVNFYGVTSVNGSGPIILVSYGSDPASKASVCPLGGAMYLGSSGSFAVKAPSVYFLANNGLCFDKTKFDAYTSNGPSFGGLSGKNIYISTNSGSPHDPTLSTSFNLSAVPIDLSWHAARYRRL